MAGVSNDYENRGQIKTGNNYNAVFTDKTDNSSMDPMDFIKLMVAQMQNQDFMNPMDDAQYVTQMAQFANMQQMQEMAAYSKSNYAMSLVGKTVTASRFTVGGDLDTATGPVQKVSLVDNEYVLYVGGKRYTLAQVMAVESGSPDDVISVDPTAFTMKASDISSDGAQIKWEVPTEDEATAAQLTYTVYYSKDGPFDTVEQVEQGTKASPPLKALTEHQINGLEANATYYVNVVVCDAKGTKTVYKPTTVKTKEQ